MSGNTGLYLEGIVRINPYDSSGALTGYLDALNTPKLAITQPAPDIKERISNMRGSIGQALGTVYTPKPAELSIDFDDQPYEVLQMAFMGSKEAFSQTSGTVTDEAITLIPGRWQKLASRNISAVNVSTVAVPGTPLAITTDYLLDLEAGLIKAVVGGAIATPTPCLVDYTKAVITGTKLRGSVKTVISCQIRVDGINSDNGKLCELLIHKADLYQNGDIDFMAREFITTSLKGKIVTPAGFAESYTYLEY